MSNLLAPFVRQQAFKLGVSSPGAVFSFFLSGTSTPQPVYNAAGTSLGTTLTADSTGRFVAFFLAPVAYRVKLVDSTGATVWQEDGITSGAGGSSADFTFLQDGTGAVTRTAQNKMRERVSIVDFGADNTGVADSTAAVNAALTAVAAHNASGSNDLINSRAARVWVPYGIYKIAGTIAFPARSLTIEGETSEGSLFFLSAAGATISSTFPQSIIRNLEIFGGPTNGSPVANIGVTFSGEECVLDNATIYNFAVSCLDLSSSSISRLVNNTRLSVAPKLLRLTNVSALSIIGANFFQLTGSTAAIDILSGSTDIEFIAGWAEGFTRFLRVANGSGAVSIGQFNAAFSRFVSTITNARLVEVVSSNVNNLCRAIPIAFRDCNVNLTNSNYAILVTLTGNLDANSGVSVKLDNVAFPAGLTAAIVSSDVATTRVVCNEITGVASTDYLDGLGSVVGVDSGGQFQYDTTTNVLSALHVASSVFERGRAAAMGDWTNVTFSAGNFAGNASMTWVVGSLDQSTFRYSLTGKTMTIAVVLSGTTVGGTPNTELRLTIPGGVTVASIMGDMCYAYNNGLFAQVWWLAETGVAYIKFRLVDGSSWAAATDATSIVAVMTFEIA